MKFWDFQETPYRPIDAGDVFMDGSSRLWYAGTPALRALLPPDPLAEETIPPEFWHPDAARRHASQTHEQRKRENEDAWIDTAARAMRPMLTRAPADVAAD